MDYLMDDELLLIVEQVVKITAHLFRFKCPVSAKQFLEHGVRSRTASAMQPPAFVEEELPVLRYLVGAVEE